MKPTLKVVPPPKSADEIAKLIELQAIVESWGNEKSTEVFIRTLQHARLNIVKLHDIGLGKETSEDKSVFDDDLDCLTFIEGMIGSLEEAQQAGHQ